MTQPPYGPPPQGPADPGWTPSQPPYGQPPGVPGYGPPAAAPYTGQLGPTAPYPRAVPLPKKPFYQRPWVIAVAGLFVLGSIGNAVNGDEQELAAGSAPEASTSATVPSPAAPTTPSQQPAAVAPPATTAPTTPAAPVVDFTMPDFVGTDLQTAQNLLQTQNVWLSFSHDLRGSRNQALDSNWIVCDQNIPPGQQVTGDVEGDIDFGVVKRGESCP